MHKYYKFLAWFCLISSSSTSTTAHHDMIAFQTTSVDDKTLQIKITFSLNDKEFLYKDSLSFSVDSPAIQLSEWHSNFEAHNYYDQKNKETRLVFENKITLTLFAHNAPSLQYDEIFLYVTYQTTCYEYPQQELFQLVIDNHRERTPYLLNTFTKEPNYQQDQKKIQPTHILSKLDKLKRLFPAVLALYSATQGISNLSLLWLIGMLLLLSLFCLYRAQKSSLHRLKRFYLLIGLVSLTITAALSSYFILAVYVFPKLIH
jgi:hypothetical protein